MKTWKSSLLLAAATLLATSAFAANKASMRLQEPVNVSGKQLTPGGYTVSWEGSGPGVELSILKGKNVVAKVPAKVVDLPKASAHSAIVTRNSGGAAELTEIQFGGKKFALEVGDAGNQAEASNTMK